MDKYIIAYFRKRSEYKNKEELDIYATTISRLWKTEEEAIKCASEAVMRERSRKKASEEKKSAAKAEKINELKEKLKSLKLNKETLSKAIEKVSDDGSNYEEVIKETKKECVEKIKKRIQTCSTLKDEEKNSFVSRILNDGSNLNEIYEEAVELANPRFEKKREARAQIKNTGLSKERKDALEKEIRGYGEYGILPKLKSNNERVLARLYDRVLEGRERKEEG
ncbi:MAG: hypothetical protein LBD19_04070, partial [Endomicrobium sp.]|nr:hypothetical protein [Endomicrobium sp.]